MPSRRPVAPFKRPLMIDAANFARIVERVRTNRAARRTALIQRWQDQRRQLGLKPEPDKRELQNFCHMVVTDPHTLQLLDRDVVEAMSFFLARVFLKLKPRSTAPSTTEIGRWVECLLSSRSLGEARRYVAQETGKTIEAVTIAHRRFRKSR
jgi:hypothetical protein